MQLLALVGEEEKTLALTQRQPGCYDVVVDGKQLSIEVHALSESTYSVLCNGRCVRVDLSRQGSEYTVWLLGQKVSFALLSLREGQQRRHQVALQGQVGACALTATMPGRVVAVLVQEGQEVALGQAILVLEAMKMENELRAPRAGVVQNLSISVGETVEVNTILCQVE